MSTMCDRARTLFRKLNRRAIGVIGEAVVFTTCATAADINFERDVRPILASRCQSCHGADRARAGLRLDNGQLALKGGDSGPAWISGKPEESELIHRVSSLDPEVAMPPKGERLKPSEIQTLKLWIAQGASWPPSTTAPQVRSSHWSFLPIVRPTVPELRRHGDHLARNPIDAFILARLDKAGIAPAPPADPETLVRRLSLDLTGLPPTPELTDRLRSTIGPAMADAAYDQLVVELLASPHFGERWGKHWLDLVRFADSDGFSGEKPRPNAWRYRDWVISAFNADMPFDRFTTAQIAGDLLDSPSSSDYVAAGMHRNAPTSRETCIDPEEYRVKNVMDRAVTTGSVWLGLTVGCCQCHSHKYDPLSQREFYGFLAFFNNQDDRDLPLPEPSGGKKGAVIPTVSERSERTQRVTRLLIRGEYGRPGEAVPPQGFSALPPLRARGRTPDRLDLARWLVDPANPLIARVEVNRIWSHLFGTGLVSTVDDFGDRGEPPSHPELLDWLASELIESGWSRKHLIRLIVASATYRQSSRNRPELETVDPLNRLLARQGRFRVEAEIVRDLALAASGELVKQVGGPSFRPDIPKEAGDGVFASWPKVELRDEHRRGLYLFMQRMVPLPFLATFGAPDGNLPCLQRQRANTPLQALTMLNDPFFFDRARAMARRLARLTADEDRLRHAFVLCLGRSPSLAELDDLSTLRQTIVASFLNRPDLARETIGEVTGSATTSELADLAAGVMLARTLFNLDEFLTRE